MAEPRSPNREQVRDALERVLASPQFAGSGSLAQCLRYCVERTIEGKAGDPQADSTISHDAPQLRTRLRQYYTNGGRADPVRIEMPAGAFLPVFRLAATDEAPSRKLPWRRVAAAAALVIGLAALLWWSPWKRAARSSSVLAVAVLPFADLSEQHDLGYFCDGLSETLIDELSRTLSFPVVARTSSFQFKGAATDVRQIGRKLNATHILEGSVRKAGSQLRIMAQLVETENGYRVWSASYDRPARDIAAVQDEIAHSVAAKLEQKLVQSTARSSHTPDPQAFELYLKARALYRQSTPASEEAALELFQQSIKLDPQYAEPYAGLADAYSTLPLRGVMSAQESLSKSRPLARKASELDPQSLDAALALARIARVLERDWSEAERLCRRAISLNPGAERPHNVYGLLLSLTGRGEEALREFRLAERIDPISSQVKANIAFALYRMRRYEEAIAASPADASGQLPRIASLLELDRREEAAQALDRIKGELENMGNVSHLAYLGYAAARLGRRAEAQRILRKLEEQARDSFVSPTAIGEIYLGLGALDRAERLFEEAYEKGDPLLWRLSATPEVDPLRNRPRYQALSVKINLGKG